MNEHMKKLTIGATIAGGLAAAPALYRLKFELPNHVVDVGEDILG